MHQAVCGSGIPTPETKLLTSDTWSSTPFDIQPVLIKDEHSSGSAGIRYFETAEEARRFVANYPFKPSESLILQEVVRGASKDLRLTMVGNRVIRRASFWRVKTGQTPARAMDDDSFEVRIADPTRSHSRCDRPSHRPLSGGAEHASGGHRSHVGRRRRVARSVGIGSQSVFSTQSTKASEICSLDIQAIQGKDHTLETDISASNIVSFARYPQKFWIRDCSERPAPWGRRRRYRPLLPRARSSPTLERGGRQA